MVSNKHKKYKLKPEEICIASLHEICSERLSLKDLQFADVLEQQVPLYSSERLLQLVDQDQTGLALSEIQAEWKWVWEQGSGILVLKQAFSDKDLLDQVTSLFNSIAEDEATSGNAAADHFAKAGSNQRIWNAIEKMAVKAPELFIQYYKNRLLCFAAEAWLGRGYQITSQTNCVNPGSEAQVAHRDYHLGFMSVDQADQYPEQIHRLSPLLTLQCAVAHVDMPLESGPTLYLPHSQKYSHGYLLAEHQEFHAYFAEHRVQLPLEKGDLVLFNPALLHAAGANVSSDIRRMANLLQISSAFGRTMESVDRGRIVKAIYPATLSANRNAPFSDQELYALIAASAEGYSFPTNLDRDPPIGGLAPPSQQDIFRRAIREEWSTAELAEALDEHNWRRKTH